MEPPKRDWKRGSLPFHLRHLPGLYRKQGDLEKASIVEEKLKLFEAATNGAPAVAK
jgi:hypothetical protein